MFNKKVFALALIIALIGINSASAESGTIEILNNSIVEYTSGYTATGTAFDFSRLHVRSQEWNQINSLFVNVTTFANFPATTDTTTFTITSGGSGSGTVVYSEDQHAIAWYFNNPTTITSSPLILSYASNIFTGFALSGGKVPCTVGIPLSDPTTPVYISMAVGENKAWASVDTPAAGLCSGAPDQFLSYTAQLQNHVINTYQVTYNFTGATTIFETVVQKTGATTNTMVLIQNSTGGNYTFQGDTTFDLAAFDTTNEYGAGIFLNASTAIGDYELVTVNSSGAAAPTTPTNTSDPNAPNCLVNCIETSKTTYYTNESVNIFGSYYPATTTTTSCLFFGYICTDTVINTEDNAGYVFIWTPGSSSPVKFIKFTPDTFHNYNLLTNLDVGTYTAQLYGFAAPGVACQGGVVYDFGAPGVELGCYYPHNTTSFQVLNATPGLYIHWNTKLANQTTLYGETVSVAWTNVTANDTVSIFDTNNTLTQSYNINSSSVNFLNVYIPLYTIGTWRATIFNGSNQSDNTSSYLNVVPQGAVNLPNDFGITMYWQQGASTINTPTTLNWNNGQYTGFYNITILKDGVEVRRAAFFTDNTGQNHQSVYTFGSTGTYVAQFVDSPNETVQAQADILISTSIVSSPGTGNITPATGQQIQNTGTNLLNLFAVTAFYGLIIWLGIVGTIAGLMLKSSGSINSGALVFIAVLAATFVALVGLFDPYKWYVLVLTWIFAGIYWRMNRDMVTEG